jgi:hypothetical protein
MTLSRSGSLRGALGALLLLLAQPGHGQAGPRTVQVSLQINSITDIDSARESFRADLYVTIRWHDPTLADVDPEQVDWSKTRKPSIEFMNSQDAQLLGGETPRVESPGVGVSEARYAGTFSSRMDLEDFPFDEQTLSIAMESQNETSDQMVFTYRSSKGGSVDVRGRRILISKDAILGREIHLPEWTITAAEVSESTHRYYSGTEPYSHLRFDLEIDRRVGYYVWKILSVMMMLVVLSWAVFLIEPGDIGNRMAVSITLLLAAVAFAYVTGSLIPRISYLTLLDVYILGCYLLLFLAPAESMLVYRLNARDKERGARTALPIARRIDRLALWCFPLIFLLLHLFIWARS